MSEYAVRQSAWYETEPTPPGGGAGHAAERTVRWGLPMGDCPMARGRGPNSAVPGTADSTGEPLTLERPHGDG